jgi:hypothetical protein
MKISYEKLFSYRKMSIVDNLITIYPKDLGGKDIITLDIFEKIWHKLNIVNWKEVQSIITKLKEKKREDLVSLIYLCQENIVIDDCNLDKKQIDNINTLFKHIKYIDSITEIFYDPEIFNIRNVRNITFINKSKVDSSIDLDNDIIIDIFVKHIKKWKGSVKIQYHGVRSWKNSNCVLYYDNGYISFDRPRFSTKELLKLRPEGYIPLHGIEQEEFFSFGKTSPNPKNFSHLNLYYALCIPTINRIKFDIIPSKINLIEDVLIPSCLIPESIYKTFGYPILLESIFSGRQDPKFKIDDTFPMKESRIKHILFTDDILQSKIWDGTHDFLDVDYNNKDVVFQELKSMIIPIDDVLLGKWIKVAPKVKTYVSYDSVMIKFYEENIRLLEAKVKRDYSKLGIRFH